MLYLLNEGDMFRQYCHHHHRLKEMPVFIEGDIGLGK
jgi:hypothetical protein